MNIASTIENMIAASTGNMHDINHFMKVWAFARTIGLQENLDEATQLRLELAAIVHDIACPLCREKYGNTLGSYQEREGGPMARDFLCRCGWNEDIAERVSCLVARHHTYANIDGLDCQILLEADFLVNADEEPVSPAGIATMRKKVFRTSAGLRLLDAMYPDCYAS